MLLQKILFLLCFMGAIVLSSKALEIRDSDFYFSTSQSFENFSRWSNEKNIIAEQILQAIGDKKKSLLDIGAGDGAVTRLIGSHFDFVCAIEPGHQFFQQLSRACDSNKFRLINEQFETVSLDKTFDVVVASHSFQFLENPEYEILRIKNVLNDLGIFLLLDLTQDSDYWKLHNKYRKDILGPDAGVITSCNYKALLEKHFTVEERLFTSTLCAPSVDDVINMFDFFYDVDFKNIKKEVLVKIKKDMEKTYGQGPVTINFQQVMYVCSKKEVLCMEQKTIDALRWIVNIFEKHSIPYQLVGGVAARCYGATRPVNDLDFLIPEDTFDVIYDDVKKFIVYGPEHYKDEDWDSMYIGLNYHGQEIDLGGAFKTKAFDRAKKQWSPFPSKLCNAKTCDIHGVQVKVIDVHELIAYKTLLSRACDVQDIEELEKHMKEKE